MAGACPDRQWRRFTYLSGVEGGPATDGERRPADGHRCGAGHRLALGEEGCVARGPDRPGEAGCTSRRTHFCPPKTRPPALAGGLVFGGLVLASAVSRMVTGGEIPLLPKYQ